MLYLQAASRSYTPKLSGCEASGPTWSISIEVLYTVVCWGLYPFSTAERNAGSGESPRMKDTIKNYQYMKVQGQGKSWQASTVQEEAQKQTRSVSIFLTIANV